MLKKVLYTLHRILGTVLCLLFLMWFLSGFVMIYHTFPKVSNMDRYTHLDPIRGYLPTVDSIVKNLPKDIAIDKLSLKTFYDTPYMEVVSKDSTYKLTLNSTPLFSTLPSFQQIENQANKWNNSGILKVDTLNKLEQWIPFGHLQKDFPIYKFYFNDADQHQLYVSSQTGNILQFTNKDNRFWAWIGAIPHWIYLTSLRQNSTLWADVIIWISGFGCIACISGIVLGIRSFIVVYRRKKKLKSPYKKRSYKWHHILGFVFGIFVFTFIFSGMMSLAPVPQWMVKVHDTELQNKLSETKPIVLANYKLDYRKITEKYPNQVKSIEWCSFGNLPFYKVVVNNELLFFDASTTGIEPLYIDEQTVKNRLLEIGQNDIIINNLTQYDNYYVGKESLYPLPVYKVNVADADHSTYYINPKSGDYKYYNTNAKVQRWSYQILHTWKSGFLVKHPILWNIVMWGTMIGGTLVSLTGVWLGFRYIKRIFRKLKVIFDKI